MFIIVVFGLTIPSVITVKLDDNAEEPQTIGIEARKLRALLMNIMEYE